MDFNQVTLCGRLTRDIELTYTPKGTAIGKFALAVNRRWTSDTGEKREEVSFFNVESFGKTAETAAQYRRKGDTLLVAGRLKQDRWEKDGTAHQAVKVIADSIQFGPKAGEGGEREPQAQSSRPAQRPIGRPSPELPGDEAPQGDDVPF